VVKDPARSPDGARSRHISRVRSCLGWETAYNMAAESGSRFALQTHRAPLRRSLSPPDLMRALRPLVQGRDDPVRKRSE